MNKLISKLGTGFIILVILFFGLKGCVVTGWASPNEPKVYSIQDQDGRVMSMIFLPHHETMIWHIDPTNELAEGVLTKMRGTYGTHYFWRLWHIDGPGILFGYRIYPEDTEPVLMEITILERFMNGRGNSGFPEKGERTHQVLLFGKNSVKFEDMWLYKDQNDPALTNALVEKLGGSRYIK